MSTVDHLYIIHALKGYEGHESRLRELLPQTHIPFTFITDGDPAVWKEEDINRFFTSSIRDVLSIGVLSCTLNHILAYRKMIDHGDQYAVFFENDPYFLGGVGGFRPKVEAVLKEAELLDPGFIISLENTTLRFPKRSERQNNKLLYKKGQGRAAGAYLMDRVAAIAILEDLQTKKCHTVIDWWHNDMISRGVIDMYWAHPVLTEQGSHNGKLHAGISSKNASIFRQLKWSIQKAYKKCLYFIR